jgi:HD domain
MAEAPDEGRWRARPGLALLLRIVILGVPVGTGTVLARVLASHVAFPSRWVAVPVLAAVAVAVSVAVSRLTSRLLPLAVLFKMTMIFPDEAPSRLKVARRSTSMADIKSRLNSLRMDEKDAAATMLALVTALGCHDRRTRGHSERVRLFCDLLSRELSLSEGEMGRLRWAALIHDIGKLRIPTAVLNKPGKLNESEWDLIYAHPDAGAQLAAPLQDWLGAWYLGIAEHHERYDGTGYPRGLASAAISTAGRAIAVVDAFETMTAARSYKSARSTLSARAELINCAGSHFDPIMVRAFLGISLPRLLWSVGPLAFLVNVPSLQWLGTSGARIGDVVGATTSGAANAASVTAVALAISASPAAATTTAPAPHRATTTHLAPGPARAAAAAGDTTGHRQHAGQPTTSHAPKPTPKPAPKGKPAIKAKPGPKVKPAAKTKSHKQRSAPPTVR